MISVPLIGPDRPDTHLSARLFDILAKEHMDASVLASARVDFIFMGQCRTPSQCRVTLVLTDGRVVQATVGS